MSWQNLEAAIQSYGLATLALVLMTSVLLAVGSEHGVARRINRHCAQRLSKSLLAVFAEQPDPLVQSAHGLVLEHQGALGGFFQSSEFHQLHRAGRMQHSAAARLLTRRPMPRGTCHDGLAARMTFKSQLSGCRLCGSRLQARSARDVNVFDAAGNLVRCALQSRQGDVLE